MAWLAAIGSFLGRLLAEILPALVEIFRRPNRVEQVGGDEDLRKEVNDDVEKHL